IESSFMRVTPRLASIKLGDCPLSEIALVLVRFDLFASAIVNPNHSIMKADCVAILRGSTDTSVALIIAKTASPFLRFIHFTEPVVMIEVTGAAEELAKQR